MKKYYTLLGIFLAVFVFNSCENKESKGIAKNDYLKLDSLLYETNNWRYKSLDSAFDYSYKALKEVNKNDTTSFGLAKLGQAYLNHANLFYLCSRFDSTEIYINKYDGLKYKDISVYNLATLKNIVNETMLYEYTYLKMLRDIQKIEMNIRRYNFGEIMTLLFEEPLIRLSYPRKNWEGRDPIINKKTYKDFYDSDRWLFAKTLYNIKYAVYNFNIKNDDEYMKNCFDALFQLSRVSDARTHKAVDSIDPPTLFYYNYGLANTYSILAELIADDTANFNKYVYELFSDSVKMSERQKSFKFEDEKHLLKNYFDGKKSIQDIQNIVKHYYQKACEIYFAQYQLLKKDENIYWRANFMQDLALLKMKLDNGEIKDIYKKYLLETFPELKSIDIEKSLIQVDSLFDKAWAGKSHIDYFQSCANKCILAKFYFSKYSDTKNKKYFINAVKFINTAEILNESATFAKAYSFQNKEACYEIFHKIDSTKYSSVCKNIKEQKDNVYPIIRKDVEERLKQLGKDNKINEEKKEAYNKITRLNSIIVVFFIIFVILAIILVFRIIKRNKFLNKEKSRYHDAVEKCYKIFCTAYVEEKSLENIVVSLSKILTEEVFLHDNKGFSFSIGIKDKKEDKLNIFAFENGEKGTGEICFTEKHRPAIICYNKKEPIYEKNWTIDYKKYSEELGSPPFGEPFQTVMYYPLNSSRGSFVFGTISAQSVKEDAFSKNQQEAFNYLADFISFSFEILEERKRTLWNQLNDVGKKIASSQISDNNIEQFVIDTYDDIKRILNKKDDDISFSIYQKIDNKHIKLFSFERNKKEINKELFDIESEEAAPRPAIGCFIDTQNKNSSWIFQNFYFSDWHKDYKKYYEAHCPEIKERKEPINKSNDTRSILLFPIRNSANNNIGVISLQHLDVNAFEETHKLIIEFIANYIGVAMENANLTQQNIKYLIAEKIRFQLDNHFTKNAFFKVGNIIDSEHKDYKYFIQFQQLFQYLVESSKKQDGISIEEDIQFLGNFISMNNVMYPTIEFEYNCEENLMKEKIPPLLLLPFVENSIIHGIKPKDNGKITINYEELEIANLGRVLECTIIDNGQGREAAEKKKREEDEIDLGVPKKDKNTSIGVNSTIDLLRHLNPELENPVQIIDLKDGNEAKGTKVIVKILLSKK